MKKEPNIYEYLDYRFYLQDYYTWRKKNNRGFTYRSFAEESGVAASLLRDIISGRQNLTLPTLEKYARAMKLSKRRTLYFKSLARFSHARNNNEKTKNFNELQKLRGSLEIKFLEQKQYEYFSQWYNAVVREMVTQPRYKGDAAKIAGAINPRVTPAKIAKSIALLEELGLIVKDGKGRYSQSSSVVSSELEIQSMALKKYHQQMISLGAESIERFDSGVREIQGLTLTADKTEYLRLKEKVRTLTDEILKMHNRDVRDGDTVFQMNLQLFPLQDTGGPDDV